MLKEKPLTNKVGIMFHERDGMEGGCLDYDDELGELFHQDDITSAVIWLKNMINGAMAQHQAIILSEHMGTPENRKIANAHLNAYRHTLKRIEEAFPDFTLNPENKQEVGKK